MTEPRDPAKIGLWTSTALVVGNMIASGVFMLPAILSVYGGISLFGWIGSSIGAVALALMFSELARMVPNSVGGPYAYSRVGLGNFAAFLVAWGYWLSILTTNAAIALGFVSYLTVFVPIIKASPLYSVLAGLAAVWMLTWVNARGVKETGMVQLVTTIMKITPLVLIAIVGLFYVDGSNFEPLNISTTSNFAAITASVALTLFPFLGLESATIPSDNISEPEKTIPRATVIGTVVTMLIYVLGSFVVMGMIPASELQNSKAPFADAAAIMWGEQARYWVAAGALVSTFGALNGWILLQGQIPMAAARDRIFPTVFKRQNKRGLPVFSLVISSVLISLLCLMNFSRSLTRTYEFMILVTGITVLLAYTFSAASYAYLLMQQEGWKKKHLWKLVIALLAFIYSIWAVVGAGEEATYWGFVAILVGIPFYIWMTRKVY